MLVGGIAHFSFYFVYKYFFGLHENIYLRMITSFLCFSVGAYNFLPDKIKKNFFPFYWHLIIIMALPFVFTVNLLQNNFNEIWLYWEIFGVMILSLCVPNWLIYLLDLAIGLSVALLFFLATADIADLNPHFNIPAYLICIIFSGLVGICFNCGHRFVWLEKFYRNLLSLTGSLVHEVRNPLNVISMAVADLKICREILKNLIRQK